LTDSIQRWHEIIRLIDPAINIDDIPCSECGGEKYCDYGRGEDVRTEPCEVCNLGGGYDEDAEYERFRDNQIEAEMQKQEARD